MKTFKIAEIKGECWDGVEPTQEYKEWCKHAYDGIPGIDTPPTQTTMSQNNHTPPGFTTEEFAESARHAIQASGFSMPDPTQTIERYLAQREAIAATQHEIWANWMQFLFKCCEFTKDGRAIIPSDLVKRWERQIETDYDCLSKREQKSDLDQADRILDALKAWEAKTQG